MQSTCRSRKVSASCDQSPDHMTESVRAGWLFVFTEKEERINKEKEQGTYKEKVSHPWAPPASNTDTQTLCRPLSVSAAEEEIQEARADRGVHGGRGHREDVGEEEDLQ